MNKWKIIKNVKKIESLLEKNYGARGRGLHTKLSSVQENLSPDLVKKIRYIGTIRNKLLHEDDFEAIPKTFARLNKDVISELSAKKKPFFLNLIFYLLLLLIAIILFYRLFQGYC